MNRLTIVGAGPVGLHAALQAVRNDFHVTVLERRDIGAAIRRWAHVRLFTPFSMNSTASGRRIVVRSGRLPSDNALLTGEEYLQRYLIPLASSNTLAPRIYTSSEVIAVSRSAYGKSHKPGKSERSASPFRLLVRDRNESETVLESDVLIDCTGFMMRHRFMGAGGIPCPGEHSCLTDANYEIAAPESSVDGLHHVVVVGSGYSAATSVCVLQDFSRRITWITRGYRDVPILPIGGDGLDERRRLTEQANRLALDPESGVRWLAGAQIESIERTGNDCLLRISSPDGPAESLTCDRVVANPGFRPDSRPFDELQIHRCYATEGPIRLASHLLGETASDCLTQDVPGAELLSNPEPGFYILGAASYGRDSRFLLRNGLQQIEQLFDTVLRAAEEVR